MSTSTPAPREHWARALIGKPWRLNADGPDGFDCRGLVRHVFRTQRGLEVRALTPELDARAILEHASAEGWRHSGRGLRVVPREWDIVTMLGGGGRLHVGVMVRADSALMLLHCVGSRGADGVDRGEVLLQSLDQAARLGFGRFEFWRQA